MGNSKHILDFGSVGSLPGSGGSEEDHDVAGPVGGEFLFYCFGGIVVGGGETLCVVVVLVLVPKVETSNSGGYCHEGEYGAAGFMFASLP